MKGGAARTLERRARSGEGEMKQGGSAGELRAPVGELVIEEMAGEMSSLPESEVRILEREVRQRRRFCL
jgi:hypothetical protein